MIFSSFNHVNCFLVFLFFGIILGFIDSLISIIFLKNYQKKFIIPIFDTVFYTLFLIIFVILLNIFNFGEFSLVLVLAYVLGFYWIKKQLKNLVAFLQTKWYNVINRIRAKRKNEKHVKKS